MIGEGVRAVPFDNLRLQSRERAHEHVHELPCVLA